MYLSPPVSLSPLVSRSLSPSLSLCLSVSLSLTPSVSLCLSLCLPLTLSLPLFPHPLSVSHVELRFNSKRRKDWCSHRYVYRRLDRTLCSSYRGRLILCPSRQRIIHVCDTESERGSVPVASLAVRNPDTSPHTYVDRRVSFHYWCGTACSIRTSGLVLSSSTATPFWCTDRN